jgi:hypothetical protein
MQLLTHAAGAAQRACGSAPAPPHRRRAAPRARTARRAASRKRCRSSCRASSGTTCRAPPGRPRCAPSRARWARRRETDGRVQVEKEQQEERAKFSSFHARAVPKAVLFRHVAAACMRTWHVACMRTWPAAYMCYTRTWRLRMRLLIYGRVSARILIAASASRVLIGADGCTSAGDRERVFTPRRSSRALTEAEDVELHVERRSRCCPPAPPRA